MGHSIFDWNGVTLGMLVVLAIVGIIMHYIIFTGLDGWDSNTQAVLDNIQATCLVNCDTNSHITHWRDKNYYTTGIADAKKCIFTLWEFTHFLFHACVGYFYNIYTSLTLSVGYEIYEHCAKNCGSCLDLVWNFSGFLLGTILRYGVN